MKPTQYLSQLEEDVRDVTLDDVKKEHLLKTIPPRIREIMGKAVESKSAQEVAKMADQYFDNQGCPLEKSATSISSVTNNATPATSSSSSSFTTAFVDHESEVNFVNKGKFNNKSRSRSRPRFGANNNRPNSSSASTTAATSASSTATPRQPQQNNGLCRFHRMFGDTATKCISDCPKHSAFLKKQQQQGNGTGSRRQ